MNRNSEAQRYRLPLVNIQEQEDRVILNAELPGVSRDSLEVTVEGDEVTIAGTRPAPEKGLNYVYRENVDRSYRRKFVLGNTIDRNRIEATMRDGILTLVLRKTQEETPRAIEIK